MSKVYAIFSVHPSAIDNGVFLSRQLLVKNRTCYLLTKLTIEALDQSVKYVQS